MTGKARGVRIAGVVAVAVVAGLTLRNRLPDPDQLLAALTTVRPWFLVLAVAAEAASLRHFALQQRRLLAGFGVGMSIPRAIAVTMSRSAISASVPAGSAVSASYAFRQFRTAGASRQAAGSVTVLSGLLSGVALALMYLLVLLVPSLGAGGSTTVIFVLATLVLGLAVFAVDWRMSRQLYAPVDVAEAAPAPDAGLVERLFATVRGMSVSLRNLPPRTWLLSLLHATVNWATDFACLAAIAAAFDVNISLTRLATVYLTVQLVRQVPLSPGGIGVIEVALVAGLISVGANQAAAAAAVLIYRLLSCWVIIPIGGLAYALLRRGDHHASPAPSVEAVPAEVGSVTIPGPAPTAGLVPAPAPTLADVRALCGH